MKITIFAAGSQGDIQPCITLGRALEQAGYQVTLAVPEDFVKSIQIYGVPIFPLRGEVQKIMASETGQKLMGESGSNPIQSIIAMRKLLEPVVIGMANDAFDACRGADAVICLGVFSPFGSSIAEALSIPLINIEPTPLIPTKDFPAPSWPIQINLGGLHNIISGISMLEVIWLWYRPYINKFRSQHGLPPRSSAHFYQKLRSTPMLGAYSPSIIPPPNDWPSSVHITGYFFLDSVADWHPSPELEAFLDAGDPPVYFGFGSMAGKNPKQQANIILETLEKSGARGLISTGWGGLEIDKVPANVFVLESAPHSWLFPRMAAVVHHGGAGTTAEGLRAGIPSVILPFAFDQFFWGARVKALKLGPDPIPQKRLSQEKLAKAIISAITDSKMKHRAQEFGKTIRAENGADNAVDVIRQYLGHPDSG
jgi:UDP:flavonoid glycosyltransferase YjiC (YdhE family)